MKKSLPFLGLILLSFLCIAGTGTVIQWYSQQPHFGSINDTDIVALERPVPHGYGWVNMAQVKSYATAGIAPAALAPSITSFVNNVNAVEIGSTVNSTTLTWVLGGGAATQQSLNQGLGIIPVGTLTKTDLAAYTVNRTYTLTVNNPNGSATANTSVSFLSKRYWGPQAASPLNDAQINALNGELATTYVGFNHTVTCAAQYIYFAFPTAWGVPNVNVNGLLNTAWTITTVNHQNASLYTTQYYVYRSNNLLTGSYIVQLVAP